MLRVLALALLVAEPAAVKLQHSSEAETGDWDEALAVLNGYKVAADRHSAKQAAAYEAWKEKKAAYEEEITQRRVGKMQAREDKRAERLSAHSTELAVKRQNREDHQVAVAEKRTALKDMLDHEKSEANMEIGDARATWQTTKEEIKTQKKMLFDHARVCKKLKTAEDCVAEDGCFWNVDHKYQWGFAFCQQSVLYKAASYNTPPPTEYHALVDYRVFDGHAVNSDTVYNLGVTTQVDKTTCVAGDECANTLECAENCNKKELCIAFEMSTDMSADTQYCTLFSWRTVTLELEAASYSGPTIAAKENTVVGMKRNLPKDLFEIEENARFDPNYAEMFYTTYAPDLNSCSSQCANWEATSDYPHSCGGWSMAYMESAITNDRGQKLDYVNDHCYFYAGTGDEFQLTMIPDESVKGAPAGFGGPQILSGKLKATQAPTPRPTTPPPQPELVGPPNCGYFPPGTPRNYHTCTSKRLETSGSCEWNAAIEECRQVSSRHCNSDLECNKAGGEVCTSPSHAYSSSFKQCCRVVNSACSTDSDCCDGRCAAGTCRESFMAMSSFSQLPEKSIPEDFGVDYVNGENWRSYECAHGHGGGDLYYNPTNSLALELDTSGAVPGDVNDFYLRKSCAAQCTRDFHFGAAKCVGFEYSLDPEAQPCVLFKSGNTEIDDGAGGSLYVDSAPNVDEASSSDSHITYCKRKDHASGCSMAMNPSTCTNLWPVGSPPGEDAYCVWDSVSDSCQSNPCLWQCNRDGDTSDEAYEYKTNFNAGENSGARMTSCADDDGLCSSCRRSRFASQFGTCSSNDANPSCEDNDPDETGGGFRDEKGKFCSDWRAASDSVDAAAFKCGRATGDQWRYTFSETDGSIVWAPGGPIKSRLLTGTEVGVWKSALSALVTTCAKENPPEGCDDEAYYSHYGKQDLFQNCPNACGICTGPM